MKTRKAGCKRPLCKKKTGIPITTSIRAGQSGQRVIRLMIPKETIVS